MNNKYSVKFNTFLKFYVFIFGLSMQHVGLVPQSGIKPPALETTVLTTGSIENPGI